MSEGENGDDEFDEHSASLLKKQGANKQSDAKKAAFFIIGILTLLYCIAELGAALWIDSLTLLSDGFHNLSDVVSLYIAYWAQDAAKRDLSDSMSYGWGRTEILGGLTNGCFLLSLCLYVGLEAVPKLIRPEPLDAGLVFIIIAAAGLVVNTLGTIVFASAGISHAHSHSHGHAHGHDDGHSHGKKAMPEDKQALLSPVNGDEGHHHNHDHDHNHNHDHGHDHKLDIEDHQHEHEHKHKEKKKEKKHKDKDGHEHSHAHKDKEDKKDRKDKKDKKKKKNGMFSGFDLNLWAVFIHYLGDAVSSVFVLATGILLHFYKGAVWTRYIDPVSSLLIVCLIVGTTIPLVKRCSMILLQGVPPEIDMDDLRNQIANLDYIVSIHDLHIWQLVDGMIIASVHLMVEDGCDLGDVLYHVKKIFHDNGIHSSAIQPEYVKLTSSQEAFCVQNCVVDCEEDWCCKKTAEQKRTLLDQYSTFKEV